MSMIKLSKISIKYAAAVLVLPCLAGCFVIGGQYLSDEPIGRERVERIRPGQTSIREVLTWLGPPDAIARQGKAVVFPPPGVGKNGYLEIRSDAFFELFSLERTLREDQVVYYYQASQKSALGFIMILIVINGGGQTDRIKAERLWLLVNERSGLVEDFIYRSAGHNDGRVTSPAPETGSR